MINVVVNFGISRMKICQWGFVIGFGSYTAVPLELSPFDGEIRGYPAL